MSSDRLISSMNIPSVVVQKYERYLPTSFDDSLTMLEKVNKVVEFLNLSLKHIDLVSDELNEVTIEQNNKISVLREDFDILNEWVRGEGLELSTDIILNEWFDNGKLANIINNEVFDMKADKDKVRKSTDLRPINVAEMDTETKQLFTGGAVAVVGENAVGKENIKRKAVHSKHISFMREAKNLFDGDYVFGAIAGSTPPIFTQNNDYRSVIVEVEPNTTYTITRGKNGDLFRIAANSVYPTFGGTLDRLIKGAGDSGYPSPFNLYDSCYTLTTGESERYLVIYVSGAGQEPYVQVEKGSEPTPYKDYQPAFNIDLESKNIGLGKNLFNQDYDNGYISGNKNLEYTYVTGSSNHRSAIIEIEPNTTYTISKTVSNRFRVALSTKRPFSHDTMTFIRDEDDEGGDTATYYTFTTGDKDYYLIVFVARLTDGNIPDFMQIEKGNKATSWETYGYKFEPMAVDYKSIGFIRNRDHDGKLYVDDFGGDGKSDTSTIQDAFDYADGNIVVFNPESIYKTNDTVVADAGKVRGIEGQNALLQSSGTNAVVFRYKGSKQDPTASPNQENLGLAITEMNPFLKNLRTNSSDKFGIGVEIEGIYGLLMQACHMFGLETGLRFVGVNRNLNITNNHLWDNTEYGMFYDECNIHQQNIIGNHISYSKNPFFVFDSDIHNLQLSANDIESTVNQNTESLIAFHLSASKSFVYEAIEIVGNTIQEHSGNTQALMKFNSEKENGIQALTIGNNLIGNSGAESIYYNGVTSSTINGNSFRSNAGEHSIILDGVSKNIAISGNDIHKPIYWSPQVTKTAITGNTTNGFELVDSNDGKVLVANNI